MTGLILKFLEFLRVLFDHSIFGCLLLFLFLDRVVVVSVTVTFWNTLNNSHSGNSKTFRFILS